MTIIPHAIPHAIYPRPAIRSRADRPRTGLTLIELLVVFSVIAILMSLLFGVINTVRRSARQTVCMSNLRQWGLAIGGYATDHRNSIPMSFLPGRSIAPSIGLVGPSVDLGQLNVGNMTDYLVELSKLNVNTWRDPGVWNCPDWYGRSRVLDLNHVTGGDDSDYLMIGYSYYGEVNHWIPDSVPTDRTDLMDRRLEPNRLLMTDVVWWWVGPYSTGTPTPFNMNHATAGSPAALANFRGQNRLFGDGRVEWRQSSAFDLAGMNAVDPAVRRTTSVHGRFYY